MNDYSRKSEYEMRVRRDKTLTEAKYFPDPIAVTLPPKKSTVVLFVKDTGTYWNGGEK